MGLSLLFYLMLHALWDLRPSAPVGSGAAAAGVPLATLAAVVVLPAVMEVVGRGLTPGKRLLRLHVTTLDGSRPGLAALLVRGGIRAVDMLPIPYGLGGASVLLSPLRQRLGDRLAATVVVHEPRRVPAPPRPTAPDEVRGFALSQWPVERLSDDDLAAARRFLGRSLQLPWTTRQALGVQTSQLLAARLGLPSPPPLHPEVFIHSVVSAAEESRGRRGMGLAKPFRAQSAPRPSNPGHL